VCLTIRSQIISFLAGLVMIASYSGCARPPLEDKLIAAAAYGRTNIVLTLLEQGADVNAKGKDGSTALRLAAFQGHTDTVQALLGKGADVSAKDKDGYTALILAALQGHTDTVQALLEQGADVNAKGKGGVTALMLAGEAEIIQMLKKAGAK
jgi:ankyrin repeat protein